MNEVLIVDPVESETGGIARYIDGQITHLQEYTPRTHDISPPEGLGLTWFLKTIWFALTDIGQFLASPGSEVVHILTSDNLSFIRASAYVLLTRGYFDAQSFSTSTVLDSMIPFGRIHGLWRSINRSFFNYPVRSSFYQGTGKTFLRNALRRILSRYYRTLLIRMSMTPIPTFRRRISCSY